MKIAPRPLAPRSTPSVFPTRTPLGAAPPGELAELHARLAEADETLRAIRSGEVDTVTVAGAQGPQVFTLQGAEQAYRVLIESMNEGALTLAANKTILYANGCFARMVQLPLEQVIGGSMSRFFSPDDRLTLRTLLKSADTAGAKVQMSLKTGDGAMLAVQISVRLLTGTGRNHATVGMVVTDMTEARRTEELMRALTQRVVQKQESERADVAGELHDHITQLLCAILYRCQALVVELSAQRGPSLTEAVRLRDMLGTTAAEVERISRTLRPGVLDQLGLGAVLGATSTAFADRTGVQVKVECAMLVSRLPADTELALYRILEEALKNVEQHARAHHVIVLLTKHDDLVQLTIRDDGIGFDAKHPPLARKGKTGLGLLGMRERANYVGGTLKIKSARRTGTEIEVRIPLPPHAGGKP